MRIINYMRANPSWENIWSYANSKVGLAHSFFEAPSLKEAQDQISQSLLLNLGPEIGVLKWRKDDDEENDEDVWILSASISLSDSDDIGYLKNVNNRIKSVDDAVLKNIELTEEERNRRQQRIDRLRKEMERPSGDPEDNGSWGRQPSPNPYWDPPREKYPPRGWRNEYIED